MDIEPAATQDMVTVVIPTHNRAGILGQTIASVLHQKDVAVIVIVVDDASTDDTQKVLSRFPDVTVVRHSWSTEQRKARNDGAELAQTPWLAFCDDDDLWAPTKLRRQLDTANSQGADWCTSSAIFVDEELSPIGGHRLADVSDIENYITRQNVVPGGGSGVLMRTALFKEVGGFQVDARYVEDWELWIRLFQHGKPACVDELLVAQRHWPRSYSHGDLEGQYRAFTEVTEKYAGATVRPRHAGQFEVRQRLRSESRTSVLRDIRRILRRSPEDAMRIALMLILPHRVLRWLYLRPLGSAEVHAAVAWVSAYRSAPCAVPR